MELRFAHNPAKPAGDSPAAFVASMAVLYGNLSDNSGHHWNQFFDDHLGFYVSGDEGLARRLLRDRVPFFTGTSSGLYESVYVVIPGTAKVVELLGDYDAGGSDGEPLPGDRESVFWINFLEVPPRAPAKDDLLRLASRMRMKLLYRPQGLSGKADEAVRQLRWSLVAPGQAGAALLAGNPTPYYVSFAELALGSGNRSITLQGITVEPFGSARIALPDMQGITPDQAVVHYQVATDSGETLSGSARIQD